MLRIPRTAGLILACLAAPAAAVHGADIRLDVDWPAFLARHDLVWKQAPRSWGEGAFTGNGLLGTMAWATNDGRHLRWHVGRSDVAHPGVTPSGDLAINRLPIGDLVFVGRGRPTSMRLDLWNAEVVSTWEDEARPLRLRWFTAAGPMVHVVEITHAAGDPPRFAWEPALALDPRLVHDHTQIKDKDRHPNPTLDDRGPVTVSVQPLNNGSAHATAWREQTVDETHRVLYLSVGFAAEGAERARQEAVDAVTAAAAAGLDRLVADHRVWWHAYWPQSFVSIPDTRLESLYWIQMYKLASATRADRPAIDLLGPWYDATPWPRIWWNLNIQLTYWPTLGANRLEIGESLPRLLDSCGDALVANAAGTAPGAAGIGRTSGYDCKGVVSRELCNLPWALHNYWLHYRHTMDDERLRDRLLPLLRRSMSLYVHLLVEGEDGRLHLPRGMSPEYDTRADHTDTAIDLGLLRWGLETILESNRRLKIRDPREGEWRRTLARLAPFPADATGLRVAADTAYAESHRHYSHLFPIFPLYLLRWDQPADRDLITRSFDHWLSLPQRFRGYSWTGAASIAASIGRPDAAAGYLSRLLEQTDFPILPNTMYREAGPVIETPLSAASSLHDLLLQSWGGTLRVFPGVPKAWPDVAFHDLRAQGAFLVSAVRREGKTRFVRIESLAGEPCRVATDIVEPRLEPAVPMRRMKDGTLELRLRRGQSEMLIAPGETAPTVAPVDPKGPLNSFGLP